jgi:hypothetical protein
LLPWVLCACAETLLGLAALVSLLGRGRGLETLTSVLEVVGFVSFPLAGAVIAARLPANPYGWVWCGLGLTGSSLFLCGSLADQGVVSGWWLVLIAQIFYVSLTCLLAFVFLLFPTGRPPGRPWRWLSRAIVTAGALLIAATPFTPSVVSPGVAPPWAPGGATGRLLTDVVTAGVIAALLLVIVAMASVAARFRDADPTERQQVKWFLLAAAVNAVYLSVDAIDVFVGAAVWVWVLTGVLTLNLVPASVAVAVLRYRLWEIDRIISRTVAYGLLTGALVILYLVVVAALRPLLEPLTGGSSPAVAGSTLAVAAVFNPARRRLQAAVDRRFHRARYDARRAVDAFAARLRDQVDLDQVSAGLRDTVASTVAPTRVAVWLRVPSGTGRG